ncbi:uncharacterized protein EI97DRAFT_382639 [Westerdykella ornata]|uniref:Transcription factor IIIC putative zinc-finger domain-containing protein n=1 Tax=Westerdykella ornata TaxID=318751 RepID=A0A6A6JCI8_WESOR|nr:uncharacterized protein EI97DRAFT_382639 [Westerdykella ornata]KAF2273934.1 hypothetical protein EI97DRAFT_382639 [Westerdykella ornata]
MSDVTTLRLWPSCLCALDWSDDGILALASHDNVELLFPHIQAQESERDMPQWQHFPLQTPWFTKDELPAREPAPTDIYSIGEEISTSYTVALAWSPPGLAKHRKCALAVLTSNLVLSLWDSQGKPQDKANWERKLIVNHALTDYFKAPERRKEKSYIVSDKDEALRLRQRVRCFAWAPASPTVGAYGTVGTRTSWLQHMIALSNDDNHIVIMAVDSPASRFHVDQSWTCQVLAHFVIAQDPDEEDFEPTFEDLMDQQRHVSHISWSPWTETGDGLQSIVAYATNKDVRLRALSYANGNIDFGAETILPDVELRFTGPMTWSPETVDGALLLTLFAPNEAIFLTILPTDASILQRRNHHLDGRIDDISGFAWDNYHPSHPIIHFSSHLSTTRNPTAVLKLSSDNVSDICTLDWPYWRQHIRNSQGHFSAENDLGGQANAKVWGITASPLGDLVASCHSCHPTDMIEYGVNADRSTTVTITDIRGKDGGDDLVFPVRAVSAESIFFTVRKWIEKNVESAEEMAPVKHDVYQKLLKAYAPVEDHTDPPKLPVYNVGSSLTNLIAAFKHEVFFDPNTRRDRYEVLSSHICTPNHTADLTLPRLLIAFRLAQAVLRLPHSLSSSHPFSQSILLNHRRLVDLVQSLSSSSDLNQLNQQQQPDPESSHLTEPCTFCSTPIPFTDLNSAVCPNGHEFVRCGVSLRAIMAPGVMKKCGICGTAVLAEDAVLRAGDWEETEEDEGSGEEEGQNEEEEGEAEASRGSIGEQGKQRQARDDAPINLAQLLFLACDVCIYCGGKYVG